MAFRPFGIEVERKTDFLALAAFLLALGGVLYQIYGFFQGPHTTFFPPEQIIIKAHEYPGSGFFVRFGARLSYVNTGHLGYNHMLKREKVRFHLGGEDYEQVWQEFKSFDLRNSKIVETYHSDAHPVPINAGSAESHDTYFAPRSIRCTTDISKCNKWKNFLAWDTFIDKLAKEKELTLNFTAELFGDHPKRVSCYIEVNDDLINRLRETRVNSPACWQKTT